MGEEILTTKEARRKDLLERANAIPLTWDSNRVTVGGYRNEMASVLSRRPGSWAASWDTIEEAVNGDKTLDNRILWNFGGGWLGY